ncbi:MFS transporter [Photobacterium halotolerans]|uniref:MFS transporter n=1 Tax=Photobacterium halotolerans TaxID=265726 RepID=UPI00041F28B0|nr:MFS transporter [Photobacterium halotolerans]
MDSNTLNAKSVLRLALLINMLSVGTLMMVMPLRPDLVRDIGLQGEHIGYISGGATFGSAIIGFFLAPVLDRYDRRAALTLFLLLRSVLIALCGLATTPEQLLLMFIAAGCFSGPLSGLIMASVLDVTKVAERGRAMAFVASGFSLAAIIIVPASLLLAQWLNWQMTFFFFGGMGLILAVAVRICIPSLLPQQHMPGSPVALSAGLSGMIGSMPFLLAMAMMGSSLFGHFLLVPNLSAYFQFNLGFPRDEISYLYLLGGIMSILAMRYSGRMMDKGSGQTALLGLSAIVAAVVYYGFVSDSSDKWVYLIFMILMASSSARSAVLAAFTSRVPPPQYRAAFMTYQSTVSNLAAGVASIVGSIYLVSGPEHQLLGLDTLATVTIVSTFAVPLLACWFIPLLKQVQVSQQTPG